MQLVSRICVVEVEEEGQVVAVVGLQRYYLERLPTRNAGGHTLRKVPVLAQCASGTDSQH